MDNWTGEYKNIGETKAFIKWKQEGDNIGDMGYLYMRKQLWEKLGKPTRIIAGVTVVAR